jgi:hypothetical protein
MGADRRDPVSIAGWLEALQLDDPAERLAKIRQ